MSRTGEPGGRDADRPKLVNSSLTRRSFVGGLVVLAGCNGLDIQSPAPETGPDEPSTTTDEPTGSADTGSYLTIVESSFVQGRTFDDDRPDERGHLLLRVRNDAGRRMRAVDLMPSFYDTDGQPVHVGTRTVWNLDADETWHVAVPYPGLGQSVGAFQVAGTFTIGTAVTGTEDNDGEAGPSPLELVAGSDALAVDTCEATVTGTVRNTGTDGVRYAGVLVRLYADDELLGTPVAHRVGLDVATSWQFTASTPIDDLVTAPTSHAVEVTGPWWARGY